ncbi:MAG: hypothetical protein AAF735_03775 [Myxococcota bacterium]
MHVFSDHGRASVKCQRRLGLLITLFLCSGAAACSDDEAPAPRPDDPNDPNEASFLITNRVRTPDTRAVFLSLVDRLELGQLDISESLEVSGVSRGFAFGDFVFTADGESGFITRYIARDGQLVPDTLEDGSPARVGFGNLAIDSFTSAFGFISAEKAYYIDTLSGQDQVVVWNPTEMAILSDFDVPELSREAFPSTTSSNVLAIDGFVVVALSFANLGLARSASPSATLAIFDANEDRLVRIIDDERGIGASSSFIDNGAVYVVADGSGGVTELFSTNENVPPPCLLRWIPGESAFDPDYYVNLREEVDVPFVSGVLGNNNGAFVTQGYTSDVDPNTLTDFGELIDDNLWQWFVVDLQTLDSTLIDTIPPGGISSTGWVVDERFTVPAFDDSQGQSTLFQIEGNGATELFTITGEINFVARLE